jgi:phosphoribosylglycinamide formyltransferase-1
MINAMFRLAILASGHGSNLRALIEAQRAGTFDARIVGVFSDKPDCGAIALAAAEGLAVFHRRPKDFATREGFDESLFSAVAAVQPDLIVCAGYMRLISEAVVRRFPGCMINLHPSLLPKYPGLRTHERVLTAGDAEHGASVHVVTPALDAGPVLAQARVPVQADDTPERLAQRVQSREHPLLVQCVKAIVEGRAVLSENRILWRGKPLVAALALNEANELEEPH